MTKEKVISNLTEKLLKQEELLDRKEKKIEKLQTENEKKEKAREKWHDLYIKQHEASERNKQERQKFAKKVTVTNQKLEETVPFPKLNAFLLILKKIVKKYL